MIVDCIDKFVLKYDSNIGYIIGTILLIVTLPIGLLESRSLK